MTEQVQQIFVEDIIPNRFQPRLTFDEKALQELSDSIKVHGVIQPLVLRRVGNKYEIIAGERRYKASCMAGLKTVPAVVREMTDNESAEVALIENVQRKNLSAIEEAQSFKNLLDRGYLTQEELAGKIGVSQSSIANKLRLLNLCDEVQNALLNEQISERHARSLLALVNPDDQKAMLNRIIKERLTVKQLDAEIKKKLEGAGNNEANDNDNLNGGMIMEPTMETKKNIFGISVETPTDLESSAPNLSTGLEVDTPPVNFNPFSTNIPKNEPKKESVKEEDVITAEDVIETFDMFGDVFNSKPNGTIAEDAEPKENMGDQINDIREVINRVKDKGFSVDMEEFDFTDMYQMIIKIKK